MELGGIPPTARHLIGPHQLPTHFALLGKSDGRMKMLIADVVLAGAFGVGGVGNSVRTSVSGPPGSVLSMAFILSLTVNWYFRRTVTTDHPTFVLVNQNLR